LLHPHIGITSAAFIGIFSDAQQQSGGGDLPGRVEVCGGELGEHRGRISVQRQIVAQRFALVLPHAGGQEFRAGVAPAAAGRGVDVATS
jgi:hypothetical protein